MGTVIKGREARRRGQEKVQDTVGGIGGAGVSRQQPRAVTRWGCSHRLQENGWEGSRKPLTTFRKVRDTDGLRVGSWGASGERRWL